MSDKVKPTENNKTALKKRFFINAYQKHFGNISKVCEDVEINRSTYYSWMKDDPMFKAEIDSVEPDEILVDYAENALMQRIERGDTTAIIFALKTKGKHRGYIERHEYKQVEPIHINIDDKTD